MTEYDPRVQARHELTEVVMAPVSYVEAQTELCPKCGAGKRRRCMFTREVRRGGQLVHYKGQQMYRQVHNERKQAVRLTRRREFLRTRATLGRVLLPPTTNARQAVAAMRAWDVAEYERLRAWWAANGHIVAGLSPCRADGTMPGPRTSQTILSDLL